MVAKSIDIGTADIAPFEPGSRKLLIEWAPLHVHVLLWNHTAQTVEALESFSGSVSDEEDWEMILGQSRLLPINNLETLLICASQRLLPVPQSLFQPEQSQAELNLLLGNAQWQQAMADLVPEKDMVLAWQMPQSLLLGMQKHFDVLTVRHLAGALLKQSWPNGQSVGKLVLAEKQALLLLQHSGALLFAGMLPVLTSDDLAYRLLNICQQYNVPVQEVQWIISGMVEKEAALYLGIEKYLQQVELWPYSIEPGNGISSHYFSHLYSILL